MLKIAMQIALLISVIIFLILLGLDVMWQIALMRTTIAYLVLMILFYLSVLMMSIVRGRQDETQSKEAKEAQG